MMKNRSILSVASLVLGVLFWCSSWVYLALQEGYARGRTMTLIGFLLLLVLFLLGTRRWRLSFFGSSLLLLVLFFVSQAKHRAIGTLLTLGDLGFYLRGFRELIFLAVDYGYLWLIPLMLALVGLVLLALKWESPMAALNSGRRIWYARGALLFFFFMSPRVIEASALWLHQGKIPYLVVTYSPCISVFLYSFALNKIEIPNHGQDTRMLSKVVEAKRAVSGGRSPEPMPDLFVWLEESTFDPRLIRGCTLKECKSPVFVSEEKGERVWPLRVHAFGGKTWTSEFSFLSGLDHRSFGPNGESAPASLAPRLRVALPNYLRFLGYRTVAIYPVRKHYLNAASAYRSYGFDEVLDASDFGDEPTWAVSDQKLLEYFKTVVLRHNDRKPLFVFMLTMYQHGPHDRSESKPLPADWGARSFPISSDAQFNERMKVYLYRLQDSSQALQKGKAFLKQVKGRHPFVFAHFGDHHPNLGQTTDSGTYYRDEGETRIQKPDEVTYVKVYTNFGGQGAIHRLPMFDLVYLGQALLELVGLPLDRFHLAQAELLRECGGEYTRCRNPEALKQFEDYVFRDLKILNDSSSL